MRKHLLFST